VNRLVENHTEYELDLITRAQAGDRGAFGELVRCYRESVVNTIYRMCGDSILAEDAAQEAFIRAWKKLPMYKPQAPFRSWVIRIAINLTLDNLRAEHSIRELPETLPAELQHGPEAVLLAEERDEMIRQAVLNLPPSSRAALVLREFHGLSYQEIAETLNIPTGTVMSRLSYARKQLLRLLTPYLQPLEVV